MMHATAVLCVDIDIASVHILTRNIMKSFFDLILQSALLIFAQCKSGPSDKEFWLNVLMLNYRFHNDCSLFHYENIFKILLLPWFS